jgi:tetratricopeptide (TPR) repeat protein
LGPPGCGRTRFAREVTQLMRTAYPSLRVAEVAITPQGGPTLPFGVLGRLVTSLASLDTGTARVESRERLKATLDAVHGAGPPPSPLSERWLMHLAGVAAAPEVVGGDCALAGELSYRAVVELLTMACAGSPLLIVVEDAWLADREALWVLTRLAADLAEQPVMMVVTSAEPLDDRPGWHALAGTDRLVTLPPLPRDTAHVLVDQVLGRRDALPRGAAAAIVDHAGAVPLVVEETLSALTEANLLVADPTTGVWTLQGGQLPSGLPTTLEGLAAARLDQMPEGPIQVLRKAAAVGEVFWRALVEDLGEPQAESDLEQLETQGFIARTYRHSLEGQIGYRFSHRITREVASRDVPPEQARAWHARIAHWLAVNTGEHFDEWLGAIAWHYAQADEPARAVSFHLQAGAWARARGDFGEAATQFAAARHCAPNPDVAMEAALELGEAWLDGDACQAAREVLGEVLAWCEERGDPRLTLRTLILLARTHNALEAPGAALGLARRGLEVAAALGATAERGSLQLELARLHLDRGEDDEALAAADEAMEAMTEVGGRLGLLRASVAAARPLLHSGQLTQASVAYDEALTFANELDHKLLAERARLGRGWVRLIQGSAPGAQADFASCHASMGRAGSPRLAVAAAVGLALALADQGRFAEAACRASEALELAEGAGLIPLGHLARAVVGHIFGAVELSGHRLKAGALVPAALRAARKRREAHLDEAFAGLTEAGVGPRLYRVIAALLLAEYRLSRDPRDPEGLAAAAAAVTLTRRFEPCALLDRIGALPSPEGGSVSAS